MQMLSLLNKYHYFCAKKYDNHNYSVAKITYFEVVAILAFYTHSILTKSTGRKVRERFLGCNFMIDF